MHWRTTIVLLLITIGVGAYISLRDLRQPTREERDALAKQVINVAPDSVTQVTLQVPTGTIVVERAGSGWRLMPQGVRADESRIAGLLNQTSPLTAQRVLSGSPEKPLDDAAFGLSPEAGSITWLANGRSTTLLFGDTTAVGESRYAKRADRPEIYVVPASLFDESAVPREQFRDPSLIPVTGWTVDTLAVESQASAFALTRRGEAWWLMKPLEDLAGRGEVTTLVNRVGGIRIARFVDDVPQAERLAEWGFDHPKAALTVTVKEAPGAVTIVFGKTLPDAPGMVYAKRSDEPALYAVAASDVDSLLIDPHGLRSKACFEFFTSQAAKIELQSGDTRWTAVKRDGRWQAEGTGAVLDTARVEDLLNTAADLRLGGFVEDAAAETKRYGLTPPRGALALWSEGAEMPQRLLVGDTVQGTTNRYGRIDGRPAVVRLPGLVTNLLGTTVDALRPGGTKLEDADSR
jgi:hypothetical protein